MDRRELLDKTAQDAEERLLLSRVWDDDAATIDERTVDVHILRLRKQLSATDAKDMVETVRGLGYRVVDPKKSL